MTTMFTPDHEWINIEDHEAAVVGITLHAQDALGDVVFVDLPQVGKTSLFTILTGVSSEGRIGAMKAQVGVAKVPDKRLTALAELFSPAVHDRWLPTLVAYDRRQCAGETHRIVEPPKRQRTAVGRKRWRAGGNLDPARLAVETEAGLSDTLCRRHWRSSCLARNRQNRWCRLRNSRLG